MILYTRFISYTIHIIYILIVHYILGMVLLVTWVELYNVDIFHKLAFGAYFVNLCLIYRMYTPEEGT